MKDEKKLVADEIDATKERMDKRKIQAPCAFKAPDPRAGKYKPSSISPFNSAPKRLYNTGKAICGAKGCTRACMVSLERRGVLKNKFESPFRTGKPWTVDWSAEPFENGYVAPYERVESSPNKKKQDVDTD